MDSRAPGRAAPQRMGLRRIVARVLRQEANGIRILAGRNPAATQAEAYIGQSRDLAQGAPYESGLLLQGREEFEVLLQDQ